VLARLLGVPPADMSHVAALVPRMLHVVDPMATEEQMDLADAAFHDFGTYVDGLVGERRRHPTGDLISALAAINQADGDRLSDDELRTMVFGLWAAGFETPAIAIDNGVLTLLRYPEHAATVRDPDGARLFTEELLRWDSPAAVAAARRYTAADVELGGVPLAGGREIRVLLGAANRDPAAFADPDRFDPARGAQSLSFGAGFHYCIGSALARMEISTLMHQLTVRLPGLRLAAEPVRRRSVPLRDFLSFPVTLAGAAGTTRQS
jgi:cytochrome P450